MSSAKSGSALTPDGALGVFALSNVSNRDRGTMQLNFYRLHDGAETYRVRSVHYIGGATMTDGRAIDFQRGDVSATVSGKLDYFSYAAAIPIEIDLDSSTHAYTCGITLESTRTFNYADAVRSEPTIPKTVAEYRALPPPTPNPDPGYPHPQVAPDKLGCHERAHRQAASS